MFSCGSHNGFISTINAVLSFQLLFLCFHFYSTVLSLGQAFARRRNVCSCCSPTPRGGCRRFAAQHHVTGSACQQQNPAPHQPRDRAGNPRCVHIPSEQRQCLRAEGTQHSNTLREGRPSGRTGPGKKPLSPAETMDVRDPTQEQ